MEYKEPVIHSQYDVKNEEVLRHIESGKPFTLVLDEPYCQEEDIFRNAGAVIMDPSRTLSVIPPKFLVEHSKLDI